MDSQHYLRMCSGLITEYVARPRRRLSTIAKTVETIAHNHRVPPSELTGICLEIFELSVAPFGPDRLTRYSELTGVLQDRGILQRAV